MRESLSSSIPLSGEVEAEEVEFAPLEYRRAILRVSLIFAGERCVRRMGGVYG